MEVNLVGEALKFMALGMGIVFSFLVIMIFALKAQAALIAKYLTKEEKPSSSSQKWQPKFIDWVYFSAMAFATSSPEGDIAYDNKIKFFIEVKAIGSKLSEKDLFQIQSYSASHNLNWMVLTNGRIWKCYHLSQGNPPDVDEAFEADLLSDDISDTTEKMYLLSKEAIWRDALSDYWQVARASSPTSIAECLLSDRVINEIRKEIYKTMKQKIENELIYEVLTTQIIKGNILSQIKLKPKSKKSENKKNSTPLKKGLPAICFAYVPDETKPSTWKLRYRNPDGSVSPSHLAGAVAALSPGGFRGRRVEIPPEDLPEVKKKLLHAHREIGTPEDQIPPGIKE